MVRFTMVRRSSGLPLLPLLGALTLVAATTAGAMPDPSTRYRVVLADGKQVAARTRPVLALGVVSFIDNEGRVTTLPVSQVNVAATTELLGPRPAPRGVLGAQDLERASGRVQVMTGEPAGALDGTFDPFVVVGAQDPGVPKEYSDALQQILLRQKLEVLQKQIDERGQNDRQTTILVAQQQELQEQLSQLTGGN